MKCGWLFFALFFPFRLLAFDLTDPIFDQLDYSKLSEYQLNLISQPHDAPRELPLAQINFFLGETYVLLNDPGQADFYFGAAQENCSSLESTNFSLLDDSQKANGALTCALLNATVIHDDLPVLQFLRANKIRDEIALAKNFPLALDARLYAEGRIFLILPPSWGQELRRAMYSFLSLQRLRPDLTSVDFFLARAYQMFGNSEKSLTLFERASSRQDTRTRFFYNHHDFVNVKRNNDGQFFGYFPGIFYDPARGFGLALTMIDDGFRGTDRSVGARASAATRGVAEFAVSYTDRQSSKMFDLKLNAGLFYGVEDFFGTGLNAVPDSELTVWRNVIVALAAFHLGGTAEFNIGFQGRSYNLDSFNGTSFIPGSFNDPMGSVDVGPRLEFRFDSRDSNYRAESGSLLEAVGYIAVPSLGSYRSFQQIFTHAEISQSLSFRYVLTLQAFVLVSLGDVSFGAFGRSGILYRMPGIREGRYESKNVFASNAEMSLPLSASVNGLLFTDVLSLPSSADQIFRSNAALGGGVGIEFVLSNFRRQRARAELSYFNSEWNFQAYGSYRL